MAKLLTDYLEPSHLTPDMQIFKNVFGMDAVKRGMAELGGIPLHFPKPSMCKPLVEAFIRDNPELNSKQIQTLIGVEFHRVRKLKRELGIDETD